MAKITYSLDSETIAVFGLTYIFRPSPSQLTIFEYILPPEKGGPRHKHEGVDEVFIVVSGEAKLLNDGTIETLGPGDTAFVEGGAEHAIAGVGSEGARLIAILSPAADAAAFYRKLSAMEKSGMADGKAVVQLARQHGVEITGPPIA